jgi:hypothetical protein
MVRSSAEMVEGCQEAVEEEVWQEEEMATSCALRSYERLRCLSWIGASLPEGLRRRGKSCASRRRVVTGDVSTVAHGIQRVTYFE